MKIIDQSWRFENKPENVLETLERAARTCYKSEDKIADGSAEKLIAALIKNGHHSVLEHVNISVRIISDRATVNELVRHRLASYSQESQRYVRYDEVEFVRQEGLPSAYYEDGTRNEVYHRWLYAIIDAEYEYEKLIDHGVHQQVARSVLPNCTKTEIFVTTNIREWRHIFKLRCSKKAHPQIRALMLDMLKEFAEEWPVLFNDLADDYGY